MKLDPQNYTKEELQHHKLRLESIALRLQNKSSYIKQKQEAKSGFKKPKPNDNGVFMRSMNKLNSDGVFYEKVSLLFPHSPLQADRFASMYKLKFRGEKDIYVLYNMIHDRLMSQFSKVQAPADLVFKTVVKAMDNFNNTGSFDSSQTVDGTRMQSSDGSIYQTNHNSVDRAVDTIIGKFSGESAPQSRSDPNPEVASNFGRTDVGNQNNEEEYQEVNAVAEVTDEDLENTDNKEGIIASTIVALSYVYDLGPSERDSLLLQITEGQINNALISLAQFLDNYESSDGEDLIADLIDALEFVVLANNNKESDEGRFNFSEAVSAFIEVLYNINSFVEENGIGMDNWIPMFRGVDMSVLTGDDENIIEEYGEEETKGDNAPDEEEKSNPVVTEKTIHSSDELVLDTGIALGLSQTFGHRLALTKKPSEVEKGFWETLPKSKQQDIIKKLNTSMPTPVLIEWAGLLYVNKTKSDPNWYLTDSGSSVNKSFIQMWTYHVRYNQTVQRGEVQSEEVQREEVPSEEVPSEEV